jgi:hypothetical protein
MRLCSYVVTNDMGLAPNPFWGYCTLAVCTPDHQGIKAEKGDWFIGFSPASRGNKLIFAMEVSEILDFDDYYHDPRFFKKRPKIRGSWREQCGDNMYFKNEDGQWEQERTIYHHKREQIEQDTKHPIVFIGEHFYYFGEMAITLPDEFRDIIRRGRGVKCNFDGSLVERFLNWLHQECRPGIHGLPQDRSSKKPC